MALVVASPLSVYLPFVYELFCLFVFVLSLYFVCLCLFCLCVFCLFVYSLLSLVYLFAFCLNSWSQNLYTEKHLIKPKVWVLNGDERLEVWLASLASVVCDAIRCSQVDQSNRWFWLEFLVSLSPGKCYGRSPLPSSDSRLATLREVNGRGNNGMLEF